MYVCHMTTNTNATQTNVARVDVSTRRNASHANCDHDNSKNARAKCRREMRLLNTSYDALRRDVMNTNVIDAHALKMNARANVDVDQMTIDDIA
jgi:hypothetical protein